jgi:hypothetical protein
MCQCTTVVSQTCNLPNQIIAITGMWTRAYKAELKTTTLNGTITIHYENTSFDKNPSHT